MQGTWGGDLEDAPGTAPGLHPFTWVSAAPLDLVAPGPSVESLDQSDLFLFQRSWNLTHGMASSYYKSPLRPLSVAILGRARPLPVLEEPSLRRHGVLSGSLGTGWHGEWGAGMQGRGEELAGGMARSLGRAGAAREVLH